METFGEKKKTFLLKLYIHFTDIFKYHLLPLALGLMGLLSCLDGKKIIS